MVKTVTTSKIGLASTARSSEGKPASPDADSLRASFGAAAIGMSWQLAVVVLVPIIAGYKLDGRMHSSPLWTLLGLVVALVGSVFVIRRALASFGNFEVPTAAKADKSAHDTGTPEDHAL